jgi:tetratricopeptide (TPR) repeat protein
LDLPAVAPVAPRGFGVIDLPAPKESEPASPMKAKEFGQLDSVAGLDVEQLAAAAAAAPHSVREVQRERPSRPELVLREPDEDDPPRRRSRPSFSPEVSFERVSAPPDLLDLAAAPASRPNVSSPGLPSPLGAIDLPSPADLPSPSPPGLPLPTGDRKSAPELPMAAARKGPSKPEGERKAPPKPEEVQRMAKALQAEAEAPIPDRISIELLLSDAIAAAPPPVEPPKPAMKEEPGLGEFSPSLAGAALDIEPSGNVNPKDQSSVNPAFANKPAVGLLDASLDTSASPAPKAASRAQAPDRFDRSEEPPKKRTLIRTALLASLLILAGSSLTLMPDVGAFGWKFISDKINASSHASALAGLRARAQADLDADTFTSSAAALQKARTAQGEAPRHRPTAAYAAYLAFQGSLRFGRRGADEAFGRQALAFASTQPSDLFTLALAAQDAVGGQLDRARPAASSLAQRGDLDAAVLLGEIELAAKARPAPAQSPAPAPATPAAPDTSVAAWRRAVELKKSARTLYGLARAELMAGDAAAAKTSARAALEASPSHAGARVLLASLLWQSGKAEEEQALAMLNEVVSDGPVKSAASEPELIDAQTLLGHVQLGKSRISAAEQAFAAALKLDPQSMKALLGSGELFYRSGRYTEASARFDAAMRADPQSIPAKVGAAKTWLALERMKEAKDLLKKARDEQPNDALLAYWSGRADEALGNKKEAEAAYLEAIKLGEGKQEGVDAYVALSYLLGSQGRAEEAAAKLAEATAKYPNLPALHRAKGEIALQSGRYEEAKAELTAALAGEDDLGARFKLGVTLRRMRAYGEAAAELDKVASLDKDFPGLALEQGLLFEETGKSDKALEMFAAALEKAPNDLDLKLRVGSAQVSAGKAKQAEPILREVLRQRSGSAEANHFLGRALLMKGTADAEAMRFLERAVEIDPNRAEYHLYVGWAANESGQHARAADALKKALDLDRELADAYWQRGVLLQKQGAIVDAIADLQTALQKRPSRFEAHATLAACFQDQGRWTEAMEAWRKAIAGNDKVPEWHYRLGRAYFIRNDRPGALSELSRSVELAEEPDRPRPAWLFDAYFLLAEMSRASGQPRKGDRELQEVPRDRAGG